ncbi:flippase [Chloroflexota bacterium]
MRSSERVTRNVSLAMLGNVFSRACFLVVGIAAARYLGAELFGVYSFAMFFSFLFATLSDGGLTVIMTREIARDSERAETYLGNILFIKLALVLFSLALLSVTVAFMDLSDLKLQAVYLAVGANLIYFYGMSAIGVFRAFERMENEWVVLVLQGLSLLLLVLAAIFLDAGLLVILGAVLASYSLMTAAAWFLVGNRFVRPQLRFDASLCNYLAREAAPVGISLVLFMSYNRIGTIALEVLRDSSQVGLYNAAFSLTRNLAVVPMAFAGAILPTLSQLAVCGKGGLPQTYARAFKLMLIITLPLAVGGALLAEPIVQLIYGAEFTGAGIALQIVIWSLLFLSLSLVTRTVLEASNRQVSWTYALAAGVVVSLVLNVALIPRLGILGSSVALLAADIVIFGLAFYAVSRHLTLPVTAMTTAGLKVLASGVLMGIVVYLLGGVNIFLLVFIGAAVYGFSLLLFRALGPEELTLIKGALRPWKRFRRHAGPNGVTSEGRES